MSTFNSNVIWKNIPGMPSSIYVSNEGKVKQEIFGEDPVYPHITRSGKFYCISYKGAQVPIHRLVALAFLDNKDNKDSVYHLDGDTSNNRVENLVWMNKSEYLLMKKKKKALTIYCVELMTFFYNYFSASITTGIPETLIKYSIDTGSKIGDLSFVRKYVDDNDKVIHVDIHEVVDNPDKYQVPNVKRDYFSNNSG